MAPEKTRIERESARTQQGDGGGHDDQFEKCQRAIHRVPCDIRGLGKHQCQTEDRNRGTYNGREESNQKTGAAASQHEAREKNGERRVTTMDQIQHALRGGGDTDHRSNQ